MSLLSTFYPKPVDAAALGLGTANNVTFASIQNTPIGSTTRNSGAFTTLTANNGTLTASAPVLDLAQTWNNAAVVFNAVNIGVTQTAANNSSSAINYVYNGSSIFRVTRTGAVHSSGGVSLAPGGNAAAISATLGTIGFTGANNAGGVLFANGNGGGLSVRVGYDGENTLGQRNDTNAQTFRIYNTFTSDTNHERGFLRWSSNVFQIGTEKGSGGGTARALEFQTDGTTRMTIAGTSNAITCTGSLSVVTNLTFQGNSSIVGNVSSGVIRLLNAAQNGFDRIQFGGSTTSFPALKRDSTALQARLANDSDFCPLQGQLRIHQNAVSETITATHTLTLFDAAGTAYKVPCVAA